ncbi:LLGL scribble cell polarity complex component 2 isoform X1 [Polypterus senegalus]|uniref:LLGL scribble cell polarity complex component 2 isoform X1 n=1 Tax=Polypterus senegalus TaxID=55291 RepID=UPI00196541D0|nr:LLGL scribble cell polarity complex component 2 isoform X1 [Polypterus senegalus]XP_039595550.1 LLGL scribble cell polarity complex component 2 isoform X1 [Polypterus senegalus]
MKRFLRQGQESLKDRQKQDLFQFNKTVEHGFPHQPSALGFSPRLGLLAIGTRSGAIKLYGTPGVEFMGLHEANAAVLQIHFLAEQGQLVTLLEDNSLHLWKLQARNDVSELAEKTSFTLQGKPGALPSTTHVTAVLAHSSRDLLYLGTEGGHVFVVKTPDFEELEEHYISVEDVQQRIPVEYAGRRNLDYVETLTENPQNPNQILIGYSRGLLVLWDVKSKTATHFFLGNKKLESVWWCHDGDQVISSHSDGTYCHWSVSKDHSQTAPVKNEMPYGSFPCKAISKIVTLTTKKGSSFVIFSGGMPRASYGDRHCISVIHGRNHVAFDFTSRIIDFAVICGENSESQHTDPVALLVLAEEELVAIDLKSESWPAIQTPYLAPLHCSAITCSHHVSNIPLKLWERIRSAGEKQNMHYSDMPWPVNGGLNVAPDPPQRDLLLTGHEDGTVRFWDASGVCLYPIYKLSSAGVFLTDSDPNDNMNSAGEGEWPPFRKVGCFDPYSDDPRLGIQKIHLCKYSGYLAIAGTAGQVLVMELNDEDAQHIVGNTLADLLQDREGFKWKGHAQLSRREEPVHFPQGFQPFALVQCQPPAVITSLILHSEWKLIAFGTSHGFGLYDYYQKRIVLVRCTLNPCDQLALEGPLSRVKSIKKSLRQSFRRFRRSQASGRKRPVGNAAKIQELNARLEQEALQEMELAPVQRKIEARSSDDSFTGLIRTLYFADSFIRDGSHHTPSLWAGTNGGSVFAYSLRVPPAEKRTDNLVMAEPAKEIQLMHRAPVVGIVILDGHGVPLPEPLEVAHDLSRSPDMHGSHQLLVISEEQFKMFTLPKVSSKTKLKLTATEGSRVRKVSVATFISSKMPDHSETGLAILTNQGDLHVISLPGIKPQVHYSCIRKEDVSGIASCVFTKYGQGFYLISPSEFERFSLSARWLVEPRCLVEIPRSAAERSLRRRTAAEESPDDTRESRLHSNRTTEDAETSPGVMEHALLNDEAVLMEIQTSLEGDRRSRTEKNTTRPSGNVKMMANGE